jgi:CRISPR system Cascade subunit CasD
MKWTLLLRLAGPMQAWGTQSRFTIRDTGREPSKSGVIGLLCAALGKPRSDDKTGAWPQLSELASLRMGVRVDREGLVMRDYHTAGGGNWPGLKKYGVSKANGSAGDPVVSQRFYLADADFVVGLEAVSPILLERLDAALARPHWQLFLGRKSFVPALPVRFPDRGPGAPGLRQQLLEEALIGCPYRLGIVESKRPDRVRLVLEVELGDERSEARNDVPLSFATRTFGLRHVRTSWIATPEGSA